MRDWLDRLYASEPEFLLLVDARMYYAAMSGIDDMSVDPAHRPFALDVKLASALRGSVVGAEPEHLSKQSERLAAGRILSPITLAAMRGHDHVCVKWLQTVCSQHTRQRTDQIASASQLILAAMHYGAH